MKNTLFILLLGTSLLGYGEGALYWTPHGCDEGKATASKHGGHGKGESAMFAAMNLEGNATAKLVMPDLSLKALRFNQNTVMLPVPSMGGYYAMVAESNASAKVYSAVRYLSLFGRPVKISPTKLTALPKTALEIVPDPLHREHDHYTASKSYRFVVLFENRPLGNAAVTLETHDTPAQTLKTDAEGSLILTLPNDFKNVRTGRNENKSSEFLLTARYDEDLTQYVSTLSMPYYVNPNDYWQSQSLGAGAIFIGFLGGLFLYRRNKKGVNHG